PDAGRAGLRTAPLSEHRLRRRDRRRPRHARPAVRDHRRGDRRDRGAIHRSARADRVSGRVALVACREAGLYDHGPQHPLKPERVLLTLDLIEAYGIPSNANVHAVDCRSASDDELLLVHTPAYLDATRRAGDGEPGDWWRFGYGPGDNPI